MVIKLEKIHFIIAFIVVLFFGYSYYEKENALKILICQTTFAHDEIIYKKNLNNNIPQDFILVIDNYSAFIYPRVKWKSEKRLMDYKIFKKNLPNAEILHHLEHEGDSNNSYLLSEITPLNQSKKFPYRMIFLDTATLNIRYIDKEKIKGRHFTVIADCKTWKMASGKGGKDNI